MWVSSCELGGEWYYHQRQLLRQQLLPENLSGHEKDTQVRAGGMEACVGQDNSHGAVNDMCASRQAY